MCLEEHAYIMEVVGDEADIGLAEWNDALDELPLLRRELAAPVEELDGNGGRAVPRQTCDGHDACCRADDTRWMDAEELRRLVVRNQYDGRAITTVAVVPYNDIFGKAQWSRGLVTGSSFSFVLSDL